MKKIYFTKMHGLGNDFMLIDLIFQDIGYALLTKDNISTWANRYTGVGFDQLLIVAPPLYENIDFHYEIFNADGSRAGNCGNGARCVATYLYARNYTKKDKISVHIDDRSLALEIIENNLNKNNTMQVRVNMGKCTPLHNDNSSNIYRCTPSDYQAISEDCFESDKEIFDREHISVTCADIGNPHAVVILAQDLDINSHKVNDLLIHWGEIFQKHSLFRDGVNLSFVSVKSDRRSIDLRVFERGVGETIACGTGASASTFVCKKLAMIDIFSDISVSVLGGDLKIEYNAKELSDIYMTGEAKLVYEGAVFV